MWGTPLETMWGQLSKVNVPQSATHSTKRHMRDMYFIERKCKSLKVT